MKNIILLFLFIFFTACGASTSYNKSLKIESDFIEYVQKFEELNGNKIDDLQIQFATLDPSIAGLCETETIVTIKKLTGKKVITKTPKIKINLAYWSNQLADDNARREMLIFHELGHCILNRAHNSEVNIYNEPISIMFPFIFSHNSYVRNYDMYINELFLYNNPVDESFDFIDNYSMSIENNDECVHDHGTTIIEE